MLGRSQGQADLAQASGATNYTLKTQQNGNGDESSNHNNNINNSSNSSSSSSKNKSAKARVATATRTMIRYALDFLVFHGKKQNIDMY